MRTRAQGSAVGFCADFPKDKRLKDFPFIILLNGEEVQGIHIHVFLPCV